MQKGYVQIYTGDGKGKTTAALGLGLRAVGRGLRVIMIQFLKSGISGEIAAIKSFGERFKIINFAQTDRFVKDLNESERMELYNRTQKEFSDIDKYLFESPCDLLILDEIMGAIHAGLIDSAQVGGLMEKKPENIELVLTGRNVPKEIADKADLITEMKSLRHYAEKGVKARPGIEF